MHQDGDGLGRCGNNGLHRGGQGLAKAMLGIVIIPVDQLNFDNRHAILHPSLYGF